MRPEVERKLLEIVGPHERIFGLMGYSDTGLYLEWALNRDLGEYLESEDTPLPSVKQRLCWCRETAEPVTWIHSRRVLRCDRHPLNLLLDDGFHVKLADFQGRLLPQTGEILLEGWSAEPTRSSCPRPLDDGILAGFKTDLFALGCTIYFIMMGHAVFPDIINGEEEWREKVKNRFRSQQWPQE